MSKANEKQATMPENTVVRSYRHFTVEAKPQNPRRKTRDYCVVSRTGGCLAEIDFYASWRQHVLVPRSSTIWSAGCLADIQAFLDELKESKT